MEYGLLSVILVIVVAFLAGIEGILDSFELQQPIIACSLIGIATGHIAPCVILGGSLQMIAMGWANIGAAVAPDAALASVASAIILVQGNDFSYKAQQTAIASAIALATVGLILTMFVRTVCVVIIHQADAAAAKGSYGGVEFWHLFAMCLQGLRIAIPAALLLAVPASVVQSSLKAIPDWFKDGLAIGGGMVVAVGYAMVINMMASKEVWPFFFLGFALASVSQLTLIAMGIIGLSLAFIYTTLEDKLSNGSGGNGSNGGSSASGDPLGDILNDY